MDDVKARAAQSWFGYGRWDAPYWFVGMEPGGDESDVDYDAWMRLGGHELIGCRDHAFATGYTKWHGRERPPTQATWRRLIQVELAFKNCDTDMKSVAAYQRDAWGATTSDEALIELSALHAKSLAVEVDRSSHLDERIAVIRERLLSHQPTFAVFYGLSYREYYERIVGSPFDGDRFARAGETICVLVPHPVAIGTPPPAAWIALGHRLLSMTAAAGPPRTGSMPKQFLDVQNDPLA